jgi:hypothetical protein
MLSVKNFPRKTAKKTTKDIEATAPVEVGSNP